MDYSLFSKEEIFTYFSTVRQRAKSQIDCISDDGILNSSIDEWGEYYFQKNEIHPIELLENAITQTMTETKIKKQNMFRFYTEPEYVMVDGMEISYRIPFDGDSHLFDVHPSSFILDDFMCDYVRGPHNNEFGYIQLSLSFTKAELLQHENDMSEFVSKRYDAFFAKYRTMIRCVNADVKRFNADLKNDIQCLLVARKNRADSTALISRKLAIPLNMSPNAPNIKPIPLKRTSKPAPQRPQKKFIPTEYSIREEDYININNIIYMCGSSMEKTARSHISNDEEELRDFILATLNTHYENASGETFRRVGKTDIQVQFENQAAFIAECKVWRGDTVFTDAIQQLLSYSTWKDTKVTLVVFNKHNKRFQSILSKIDEWVDNNTKSHAQPSRNRWDCVFYRQDMEVDVKLHIVVFDLYVEKALSKMTGERNERK